MYKTDTNETCLKSIFYGIDIFSITDFVKMTIVTPPVRVRTGINWSFFAESTVVKFNAKIYSVLAITVYILMMLISLESLL